MAETIGGQQEVIGAAGHEVKTDTPPAPLTPREPLTPAQKVAGPDLGQMQEAAGYTGWLRQALNKVKAAIGLQGVSS